MVASCKMNLRDFPFDTQMCTFKLGSNRFSNKQLTYICNDHVWFEPLYENQMWSVLKVNYTLNNLTFSGDPESYSIMDISVTLKRMPLYFIVNLMIPALFLLLVTLIIFFVPFSEAINIGMNILLAYSVLAIQYEFYESI